MLKTKFSSHLISSHLISSHLKHNYCKIIFTLLAISLLAISCKKGGGGDPTPSPTYFTVSKTDVSTNLFRSSSETNASSQVGSNTRDIQINFRTSHNFKVTVTSLSTNNGSGGDEQSILSNVMNPETTFDTTSATWTLSLSNDTFTNNGIVGTNAVPLKIGLLVEPLTTGLDGNTSHIFNINNASIQYASIIVNTGNDDYSLSNAIYNEPLTGDLFYGDNSKGPKFKFKENFTITNWTDNTTTVLNFSNNQDTREIDVGTETAAIEIRDIIMTNGKFANYFSDLSVTFLSNENGSVLNGTNSVFKLEFTPLFKYELSNANNHLLYLKNKTNSTSTR